MFEHSQLDSYSTASFQTIMEMEKVGLNDSKDGDGSGSNAVDAHTCKNRRRAGKRKYYFSLSLLYMWTTLEGNGGYSRRRISLLS